MADAGEDGFDGVAFDTAQEVSAEMVVGLHATGDRFDGGASVEFAADRGGDAAFLPGDEDACSIDIVAAIAAIDIGAVDGGAGDRSTVRG